MKYSKNIIGGHKEVRLRPVNLLCIIMREREKNFPLSCVWDKM